MDMQELIEEQIRSKMINNNQTTTIGIEPMKNGVKSTSAAANLAKRVANYKFWSLFQR